MIIQINDCRSVLFAVDSCDGVEWLCWHFRLICCHTPVPWWFPRHPDWILLIFHEWRFQRSVCVSSHPRISHSNCYTGKAFKAVHISIINSTVSALSRLIKSIHTHTPSTSSLSKVSSQQIMSPGCAHLISENLSYFPTFISCWSIDIAPSTRISEPHKQSLKEKHFPCKEIVVPRRRQTHKYRPSQPYKACIDLVNLIVHTNYKSRYTNELEETSPH